jgi:hypothetical protein
MGGPGSLNIYVDGQQIYSYQKSGRLPQSTEIIAQLRDRT